MDASTFSEKGLNVSFSNVKFIDVAPFVNLDYIRNLGDAPLFDLRRSRIPTDFFKDIVSDMDILLIQYGTLQSHTTQARSRFLAPVSILPITAWITEFFNIHQIFNRLMAQIDSSFRNMTPESLMNGRITTRGKIHYFKTFSALPVLVFVEVKLKIFGSVEERINAISQVIAECYGQITL